MSEKSAFTISFFITKTGKFANRTTFSVLEPTKNSFRPLAPSDPIIIKSAFNSFAMSFISLKTLNCFITGISFTPSKKSFTRKSLNFFSANFKKKIAFSC